MVGALAIARRCEQLGTPFVLGGVAWERLVVDPVPGPRAAIEITGGEPLGRHAVLAGPDTTTPEGVRFSESHVAAHLGAPTVLIDITEGPGGAADGIGSAADRLGCDLVVYADVGGDAIAAGDEPGLGSPLCDAVMLAAGLRLADRVDGVLAVLGAGCDGELELGEVLGRVAALAAAGAWIGTSSVLPAVADELERAAAATATEASMQVVHCARGATGTAAIRGGRRRPARPGGCAGLLLRPRRGRRRAAAHAGGPSRPRPCRRPATPSGPQARRPSSTTSSSAPRPAAEAPPDLGVQARRNSSQGVDGSRRARSRPLIAPSASHVPMAALATIRPLTGTA